MSKLVLESEKNLPNGWSFARLDDVCIKITDGAHKTPKYTQNGIRFISIANIRPFKFISENYVRYISKKQHNEISKSVDPKIGDVLLTKIGTLGYAKLVDWNWDFNIFVGLALLRPNKKIISPKFLEVIINSPQIVKKSIDGANGTGRKTLPLMNLKPINIPIPPLNEQKRIVAKIEELFSKLDFVKQVIEKTKILLEQYRYSLLKSAFEGELTKKWREDNNIKKNFDNDTLENLILFSKNGFTGRPNEEKKGIARLGIETITGTNSIYVNENKHKFIEISSSKIETYRARKGDLFVCRQNGNKNYVGKSAVFNGLIKPMIFSDSLIQLRPKIELCVPEYLAFFINSKLGRKQIEKFCSTTAGNYSINGTNLKKTIITFPSVLEQTEIIQKIEEGFSLIENSERIINISLKHIEGLKKSILKQAFDGKLVPQDPNDDPAKTLLEKIKQQRQQLIQKQKSSRKKKNGN